MAAQSRKNRAHLFLFLFGIPFLAAGCGIGFPAIRMLIGYWSARDWVEARATIQSVNLEGHSDSEGGSTYKVTCRYAYDFNGRRYESRHVGLTTGADNIGSWQEQTYHRLNRALASHKTVPCFINPADPAEALLDRDVRFWLLVMHLGVLTVFGGVGAGAIAGGIVVFRHARRRRQFELDAPQDQPWLREPNWAGGIIRPSLASKTAWFVAVALIWNLLWLPVLIFLPTEVAKGDRLALLGLIGPSIGLILIVVAVRAVIQKRKFGRSYFECQPLPGVVGGHLRGVLHLVGDITTLEEIELSLNCRNTVTTKSGGESHSTTNTIWTNTQTLHPTSARFGESELTLPINFQIPYSCRPTDDSNTNDTVSWQLQVRGPAVGVDLALTFDVPVFKTAASSPKIGESAETIAREEATIAAPEPPPLARIRREQDTLGNPVIISSCWPGLMMAGVLFLFTAISVGATVFMYTRLSDGDWFVIPFVLVFSGVDLILLLILLSCFGAFRTAITPEGLEIRRSFGPFSLRRFVASDQANGFTYQQSASSGTRRWYAVFVQVVGGRKAKLAGMIEGETGAKWLIRQFEEALTATKRFR